MKHKSNSRGVNLRNLILIPQVAGSSLTPMPVLAYNFNPQISIGYIQEDIVRIKDKAVKIMDTNIKRLEKVRNRIVKSSKESTEQLINHLDTVIQFLKREKPKFKQVESIQQIMLINNKIKKTVSEHDITLGQVFDNRKDGKIEKAYNKMEHKLDCFQKEVVKKGMKLNDNIKVNIEKSIMKAKNIIEQLRNEEKYSKSRIETKILRRELNDTFNYINKSLR